MDIVTEESFSPVIPIQTVRSIEEAIKLSNLTKYGLGCTIFTKELEKAMKAVQNKVWYCLY